jgi:hypothetical protein
VPTHRKKEYRRNLKKVIKKSLKKCSSAIVNAELDPDFRGEKFKRTCENCEPAHLLKCFGSGSGLVPDPDWIRIQLDQCIQIQADQNGHQKKEKNEEISRFTSSLEG